jgi:hypothetical protein
MSDAAVCLDAIEPVGATTDVKFAHLSDPELLASTRRLVGATNQVLAELLSHLAEVEARGVHRDRLCTSLYTYCVYELRFSEDAAYRRVAAARLVQRFPLLYDAIASAWAAPHGSKHCKRAAAREAPHQKELGQLVRQLDPLPDVPAGILPLGPACREAVLRACAASWTRTRRGLPHEVLRSVSAR